MLTVENMAVALPYILRDETVDQFLAAHPELADAAGELTALWAGVKQDVATYPGMTWDAPTEMPDTTTDVQKYNHNHDSDGKFGTGASLEGKVSASTKVTLSVQHDGDMTPGVRAKIGEGLTAISGVIKQTPDIQTLNIHVQRPTDMPGGNTNILGFYNPVKKGEIVIGKQSDAATLVHEYGHMLDMEQLGGKGAGSASGAMFLVRGRSKELSNLGKTIAESPEAKRAFGTREGFMQTYATHHSEVFARAFAQYVATKSGNKNLLASIHGDSTQWSDENFKPIGDAMETYLKSAGLL